MIPLSSRTPRARLTPTPGVLTAGSMRRRRDPSAANRVAIVLIGVVIGAVLAALGLRALLWLGSFVVEGLDQVGPPARHPAGAGIPALMLGGAVIGAMMGLLYAGIARWLPRPPLGAFAFAVGVAGIVTVLVSRTSHGDFARVPFLAVLAPYFFIAAVGAALLALLARAFGIDDDNRWARTPMLFVLAFATIPTVVLIIELAFGAYPASR